MRRAYLQKLILSCLLVVFFCGGVVAILSYIEQNRLMQEELERNHMNLLETVRDKVDLKLSTSMNSVFSLKSRPEIVSYGQSDGEDPYVNTLTHQALGSHMDAFIEVGYTIDILKSSARTVITKDYTIDTDRYMERRGLDQRQVLEAIETERGNRYLTVINLEKWKNSGEQASSLKDTVQLAIVINDSRVDEICFVVTLFTKDFFPQDFKGDERYEIRIGEESFLRFPPDVEQTGEQTHYTLASTKLPTWSYHYYADTPALQAIGAYQAVIVAVTTVAAGAVFAVLIAFRTYRPVRKLMGRVMAEWTPEQTSEPAKMKPKDEFHVIHSITESIHRENQDLTNQLHGYRQPMREKLLRDLISGVQSEAEAIKELERQKLEALLQQPLSVALVHESNELGEDLIDQDMVDEMEQILLSQELSMELIRLDNSRQALLLFHKDRSEMLLKLQKAINRIHQKLPVQVTIALGTAVSGILESVTSYHTAVRLLEQLRPMLRQSLLTEEDLEADRGSGYYFPLDLEKELIQSAINQNEHEVAKILESLIGKTRFQEMEPTAYDQFTYSIQSTLHRIAQQLNCQMDDLYEEPPFKLLQQCRTQEEVMTQLTEMFKKMMAVAEEKNKSLNQRLTDSMVRFIQNSYDQDVSLSDLAEHVKMSPSYISSIFKDHMGDNFKDYLNQYRVEQAKRLIEEGEHKVSDLSARVGCNNVNTFIRIFKKAEGVSPGQYIATKNRGGAG